MFALRKSLSRYSFFNSVPRANVVAVSVLMTVLSGCSDGTVSGDPSGADSTVGCDGSCGLLSNARLEIADVETILAQAVQEAQARSVDATIAVVDRVGNVLGVYRMGDPADRIVMISSGFTDPDGVIGPTPDETHEIRGGLEGIRLPEALPGGGGTFSVVNIDQLAAISKAITGAYLSSEGMAFGSRTANQIVQEHFNPGEDFQPAGPLFGVQFSQLPCGDFTTLKTANSGSLGVSPGPHGAPLGLAADAGGLPLYKNGAVVGGIGVLADGVYGVDKFIADVDQDIDELIAIAGTSGFGAPLDRRDRVTVEGKVFRYSDADFSDLISDPSAAPALTTLDSTVGSLIAVRNYTDGRVQRGTVFGLPESGIAADNGATFDASLDAFVVVDPDNSGGSVNRYPPRAGSADPSLGTTQPLQVNEVTSILENALRVANRSRAQIRRPLNTPARVTMAVVDTRGEILGVIRGRDAPTFGADVAVQKARTSAFFSSPDAADYFLNPSLTSEAEVGEDIFDEQTENSFPDAIYVQPGFLQGIPDLSQRSNLADYVATVRTFLDNPAALSDGAFGFSDRAGGNMSRPFYPDGINSNALGAGTEGPFSKPYGFQCEAGTGVDALGRPTSCEWSVFSTGLQLDLIYNEVLNGVVDSSLPTSDGVDIAIPASSGVTISEREVTPQTFCPGRSLLNQLGRPATREVNDVRLANGLQIFPGSVPIYRGDTLVGAIGVSGDGVDQDDMISFLGVHNAGLETNGAIGNAPAAMRADQLTPRGVRLRFIQCPQSPFIGSTEDNVCDGL